MPFVKLDCGIVNSTLWADRDSREVFITSLLMAVPYEFSEPQKQIEVSSLNYTGFEAPPGWYGFVGAAGPGIIRQAGLDQQAGYKALERLGAPDLGSRTPTHDGRRMIRIDGGYLILNYMNYRDKDYTAAERMRRLRERKRIGNASSVTRNVDSVTRKSDVADADSNADTEADTYKKRTARAIALPAYIPLESWKAFEEMRKKIRAPLTDHASKLIFSSLEKLRLSGQDPLACLNQSIERAWRGVFPLTSEMSRRKPSASERVRLANPRPEDSGVKLIP